MTHELTPKKASALVKAAFKKKGVTITHTESLDLIAKLKGFNAWSHLASTVPPFKVETTPKLLTLVNVLSDHYGPWGNCPAYPREDWEYQVENKDTALGYLEWAAHEIETNEEWFLPLEYSPALPVAVTLPCGKASTWDIECNLTTREGELNDFRSETKPGLAILEVDGPLLKKLQRQMCGDLTFIVRKDNELGLLFEVEYASFESEAHHLRSDENPFKAHVLVVAALLAGLKLLEAKYPKVQFCVPDASEIVNDRPAVWGFYKLDSHTDEELAEICDGLTSL
jgi:hypothetical protein